MSDSLYDQVASGAIELANSEADGNPDESLDDIADGLLAGAVHYWLFSRMPCEDPRCEDCAPYATSSARLAELKRLVDELARESDYFHTPNDADVGRA